MSAERFLDDLARTLAEPMPRRRAVRVIGVSLAALAVPGVSPALARAGLSRPGRQATLDQATCPDGSRCFTAGDVCCKQKSPLSGAYVCRRPNEVCCCGNTACDPVKERCVCPAPGGAGGQCAPKCALVYGRGWKDCGLRCCQPHEECVDQVKGTCRSCEDQGKQTCRPFNGRSAPVCCPATRGSWSPCCANRSSAACCGPKQTCKAPNRGQVSCTCKRGTRKCGLDCCEGAETCCRAAGECCKPGETCTPQGCCPPDRAMCQPTDGGPPTCCGEREFCLWKMERDGAGDLLVPLRGTCKRGCTPGNQAGTQCCGSGYRPNRPNGRGTACVRE